MDFTLSSISILIFWTVVCGSIYLIRVDFFNNFSNKRPLLKSSNKIKGYKLHQLFLSSVSLLFLFLFISEQEQNLVEIDRFLMGAFVISCTAGIFLFGSKAES